MDRTLTPIRVSWDGGDHDTPVFDAYTVRGNHWNGFIVPVFTKDEADRIAAWNNALADREPDAVVERIDYLHASDTYRMTNPDCPDDPEYVEGVYQEDLGITTYGIGAYAWTWTEAN